MSLNKNSKLDLMSDATAVALLVVCGATSAQSTAPSVEEVVVTGTRVQRQGFEAPTPTTVVDAQMLESRTPSTLVNALAQLPAFRKTSTPTTAGLGTTSTGGQSFVNMRGLGPNRTLVLLNGQRIVPTTSIQTVDVALLPQALISRVDVVTGGASAAYGSDAVAGVVNFALDTQLDGLKSQIEGGISSHGDAPERKISLTWGGNLSERSHLVASGEYYKNDGVAPDARNFHEAPYGVVANPSYVPGNGQLPLLLARYTYVPNATFGGVIVGGPLANTQFLPGGIAQLTPCAPQTSSYQLCNSRRDDLPWNNYANMLASPQERGTGYVRITFDVSPRIKLYADALYGESLTRWNSIGATTQLNGLITIQRDNAFLPASVRDQMAALGLTSFQLGRFSADNGVSPSTKDATLERFTVGADADLGGSWTLNTYASYGKSDLITTIARTPNLARFRQSIDSVMDPATGQPICRSTLANPTDGCVPVNLFGNGSPSSSAVAYYTGSQITDLQMQEYGLAGNLSGEPFATWAGPVSVALGGEYRSEDVDQTVDPISASNGWAYNNPKPLSGTIDVAEGYIETVVPLANDVFLASNLELNAAARATDYSTSGTVETWKVGLNYSPFESIRLRATRSRDIRAPNVVELRSPAIQIAAGIGVVDPRSNQPVMVQSWTSGTPNLEPETADTSSAGVVIQPGFLPGLSASLDYYRIQIDGAISTLSLQGILNGCEAGNAALCALVSRNTVGQLTRVTSAYLNLQQITTSGFDLEAEYRFDLADIHSGWDGAVALRALGNYMQDYVVDNGISRVNYAGDILSSALPKWTWDLSALYTKGATTFLINGSYVGSGRYNILFNDQLANNDVGSIWYLNATIEQRIEVGDTPFTAYLNVSNLFDQEPPFGFGDGGANYDRIGRYIKLGVRFQM